MITIGSLFYIWQWMNHRNVAKQVEELERLHSAQIFRMELLELEIDYLTRPERLKTMAAAMMNLRKLDHGEKIMSLSQFIKANE